MKNKITIATRESLLALWQAKYVAHALEEAHPGLTVELFPVTTKGDQILDRPLVEIGGKGLFIKELEVILLEGKADIAVHSLKDMTAECPKGLTIAAVTKREDPRDAFVSNKYRSLDELPLHAKVGTSSLRRQAQLLHLRPDLEIRSLRGNVQTRLRHLDEGDFDAIILAAAGLKRLGLAERICSFIDTETSIPAAGQGVMAVEARSDDKETLDLISFLQRCGFLYHHGACVPCQSRWGLQGTGWYLCDSERWRHRGPCLYRFHRWKETLSQREIGCCF